VGVLSYDRGVTQKWIPSTALELGLFLESLLKSHDFKTECHRPPAYWKYRLADRKRKG